MQPYLGIGASASGLIQITDNKEKIMREKITVTKQGLGAGSWELGATRYTNTSNIMDYIHGKYIDESKTAHLSDYDLLYEEFMLLLRSYGVKNISDYKEILVENYEDKLNTFEQEGLLHQNDENIKLTNEGYNVANRIL
jgi:coproporphyrinogen III oxidase-like Fe-S oxidoreductase